MKVVAIDYGDRIEVSVVTRRSGERGKAKPTAYRKQTEKRPTLLQAKAPEPEQTSFKQISFL